MNKYTIIGIILLTISSIYLLSNQIESNINIKEEKLINNYLKEEKTTNKETFIALLEIPKISLKKGLYNTNSKLNNVNKNIQILNESDMPNIDKGNFILVGHSGTSKISYFKNLSKLSLGDISYIYYNNEKYTYKVTNIYEVEKTGSVEIVRNNNKRTLTMITCNQKDKTKQIIIVSELISNESLK